MGHVRKHMHTHEFDCHKYYTTISQYLPDQAWNQGN